MHRNEPGDRAPERPAMGGDGARRPPGRPDAASSDPCDLRAFIDSTDQMIWAVDVGHRLVTFNDALARHLAEHYGTVAAIGALPADLLPADRAGLWVAHYRRALTSGAFRHDQSLRDGRVMEMAFSPLRREGAVVGISVFSTDITARRRTEEALRASEETFSHVFQNAPVLVSVTDLESGRYILVNDEAVRVAGYSRDEVLGHSAAELGWITAEQRQQLVDEMRVHGRIEGLEMEFRAKDGHAIQGFVKGELLTLRGRECLVTVTVDITERRRAEAERAQLKSQLEASQRMESIGRLAGGVAHDFNNLLTVILAGAGDALESVRDNDEVREDLEQVLDAGRRAAELTRQLLTFSRRQVLAPTLLDCNDVVAGMLPLVRRLLHEDITCTHHLSDGLGRVLADRSQLEQVLMNLAVNARDAMPAAGTLTFRTTDRWMDDASAARHAGLPTGRYVQFSVHDTGPGIDDAVRDRLFEPFVTTKAESKGTGLGLSIVYGVVKQSGGHVWAESAPGEGTTFLVLLPVVP